MSRHEHQFDFHADVIAKAALDEATYHDDRINHWTPRRAAALDRVMATASVKVVESPVTGGTQVSLIVDYGDQEAWAEFCLADRKIRAHNEARDRFLVDHEVYKTQGSASYQLSVDDVRYFRLGDEPRED